MRTDVADQRMIRATQIPQRAPRSLPPSKRFIDLPSTEPSSPWHHTDEESDRIRFTDYFGYPIWLG